ncbi:MAG: hypothetical protein AAGJ79_02470 [Verrucomicrobiota bacterium]
MTAADISEKHGVTVAHARRLLRTKTTQQIAAHFRSQRVFYVKLGKRNVKFEFEKCSKAAFRSIVPCIKQAVFRGVEPRFIRRELVSIPYIDCDQWKKIARERLNVLGAQDQRWPARFDSLMSQMTHFHMKEKPPSAEAHYGPVFPNENLATLVSVISEAQAAGKPVAIGYTKKSITVFVL